ncbi:hypothetical protein QUA73_22455, partial [Microcoleus sp. K4-C2]
TIPPEWMVKIPDLAALDENQSISFQANPNADIKYAKPQPAVPEPVDLSQVNTKDNRFIWVALIAIGLILGGLFISY